MRTFEPLSAAQEKLAAADFEGAHALYSAATVLPDAVLWPAARAAWGAGAYDQSLLLFERAAHCAGSDLLGPTVGWAQALVSLGEVQRALDVLARLLPAGSAGVPLLPRFLHAVWRLDSEPLDAVMPEFAALAQDPGAFVEAVLAFAMARAVLNRRFAVPMQLPTPTAQAHWDSLLLRLPHIPPTRLVATAAALRGIADAATRVDGLVLEFGVYHGLSIRQWAPGADGLVHGFDSFAGLPAQWNAREARGALSTHGRLPAVPAHVRLWPGWFAQSLPAFLAHHAAPVRLLHIDCDLYESTRDVLVQLGPWLKPGSVLVFDDFHGYPGFERHELRAFAEFLATSGRRAEPVAFAFLGREAAFRMLD